MASDDTYNLPGQFSGVQGQDGWYYFYGSIGSPKFAYWGSVVRPWGDVGYYCWNGGEDGPRYLEISGRGLEDWREQGAGGWLTTGEDADVIIGWKAPRSGTVYVKGMLQTSWQKADASSETDDGVWFSIHKLVGHKDMKLTEEQRVFRGTGEDDRIDSVTQDATVSVNKDDLICFYIRRGVWQDCDGMYYSFTVSYDPAADMEPPVSTHDVSGNSLSIAATDDKSGVALIEYMNVDDGSGWKAYTGPVQLAQGSYNISYRAIDNTGNVEPYHRVSFTIGEGDGNGPQRIREMLSGILDKLNTCMPAVGMPLMVGGVALAGFARGRKH